MPEVSPDDYRQLLAENHALRESLQLFQPMIDALPDLLWLKDSAGRYQVVNRAFCQFHGRLREQIIGRTAEELFAPGIVAGIRAGDRAVIEQGVVRDVVRTVDSSPESGWVETTKSLVYDQQNVLLGIVGTTRDITRRKQLEDEVRASEQKLRTLFEILPVGVAITDEQRRIVEMNPALEQILGLSSDNLMSGAGTTQLYLRPDGMPMQCAELPTVRAVTEQRTVYENEVGIVKEDGTTIWTSISAAPLPIAGMGAVVVMTDITEYKRAEERRLQFERRLLEAQRLESLGILAGGIAHDFNNLLTGIMGYAEVALHDLPPASSLRADIEAVIRAARDAAHLTNQMLAYSGRGHFVIQSVSVNTLIRETLALLETSIASNCQMHYHLAEQLPPIEADATQIRQVILNLLMNAAEAIGAADGTITLVTMLESLTRESLDTLVFGAERAPGLYVRLTVADIGSGMDEATLAHIFDPFFTTKFTGRGLGLAAVLGIIRGHHGSIDVASTLGAGTIFRVLLPAATRVRATKVEALGTLPVGYQGSGLVLVVDDEYIVRALAKDALERHGFTAMVAENGAQGLEIYRRELDPLRCVILDLTMPGMSGEETLEQMKAICSDVPIILSSGFNQAQAVPRFEGKGLAGFLQKPYKAAELLDVVRRFAREARAAK